ncbi:methyltransferase [Bacillus thuringiensis]|uniref:methyltransferase n=1 Tax=Bacillus tropicus TaxID=2026188 RepID=UPI000775B85F|nr:methyltransferase [Bacillus tropicus]KXO03188.1 methyltransferase [Bacillus thuringiensis]
MISGEIGVKDVIGGSVADERAKKNVIQKFNEMIANDLHLQSVLIPIGDGMTVSKVKQ